jgi:hypothetical protein
MRFLGLEVELGGGQVSGPLARKWLDQDRFSGQVCHYMYAQKWDGRGNGLGAATGVTALLLQATKPLPVV